MDRHAIVVGAGPCGLMLGYLLGRAGLEVTVFERKEDFSHATAGDGFSALSLRVFREVGLVEKLLSLHHNKVERWELYYDGRRHSTRVFSKLARDFPFLLVIPPVEVLNLLATEARKFPEFELRTGARVTQLLEKGSEVTGVAYRDDEREHRLRAQIVIGADGSHSSVRALAGLSLVHDEAGDRLDVLRARIASPQRWPEGVGRTYLRPGASIVWYPDRDGDSVIIASLPWKGTGMPFDLAAASQILRGALPSSAAAHLMKHLPSAAELGCVEFQPNRARSWSRPGLLLLGPAAHASEPFATSAMALALRDAVVAANHLARALRERARLPGVLARIEAERLPE
ncbi:MAG: FAD-dependent monooxygenase, partial [Thermoanaerobaculia bacterium]